VGLRAQWGCPTAPESRRTPNAPRPRRRRAESRQRMDCGGLPPLCEASGVETGLPTGCDHHRVEAATLCARAAGRPLRAGKQWPSRVVYPREQRQRRDDRSWQRWKERLSRGPVGSSCRDDPCPFQQTGQFGDPASEKAPLGLETFWRNECRPLLFPTASPPWAQKLKCAKKRSQTSGTESQSRPVALGQSNGPKPPHRPPRP
jgi:hypothetical protein